MELTQSEGYRLQPRINLRRDVSPPVSRQTATSTINVVNRLFSRSSDSKCEESPNSNTCEKPVSVSTPMIVAVVVVPVVILAGVLFYLHRRNVQRQRLEDIQDPHKSLDFGLNEPKKSNRKSLFMGGGEKGLHHKQSQLSMDMNLSSPYLLPPGLQQSKESLHSLARSLGNDHHDPYQQVTNYTNSETGSMRSMPYGKDSSSLYSKRMSTTTGRSSQRMPPPRTNSLPKSPTSPSEVKIDPFSLPSKPEPAHKLQSPVDSEKNTFQPKAIIPEIGTVSDFDDKHDSYVQQPEPARSRSPQFELPALSEASNSNATTPVGDGFPLPPHRGRESNGAGLGLNFHLPKGPAPPTPDVPQPSPLPPHDQHPADSNYNAYQPEIQTTQYYEDIYDDYDHGHAPQRASYLEDIPPQQLRGLGVPQQDNKRLSVGFRPLPPDEVTESEDPEYRANRIRSFYKEYFEDYAGKEPPPPMPAPPHGGQHQQQPPQQQPPRQQQGYYEDYDQGYLGEAAAYFDPDTNAFVMPYAEPVTRRAMTPPPTGRQFRGGPGGPGGPGPRNPRPHGPHGSLGGMSAPGGPRGRSRAGSAFGPRPDSSASARGRQPPKKNLPPPAALTTLPTPSKLKDDSFAIMGAIDFAPPDRIKDTAAGRSQSPFGERRPYSPQVPVATPVVSAFEELAALPSPHLLRKSSTFTGLDFAPPKKFKDADTMSDAGSIRSNRSGISAAQLGAIRGGAGRVSRLPGDTVFTQASLSDQLKPQWGMRP
ncbi:hypothetical protein EDB81DRAFT_446784 [Dactylonectria macrodidyma]|uniref:Uncharacterized protein n=1 Tax=Dactylonectria macrodidyma TaxID=307937 RepID=A0A9P9JBX4_9HYPO|nr:hypothetical protein EDB81DRAFT_446784 [Dactylonectria macrodidyma]